MDKLKNRQIKEGRLHFEVYPSFSTYSTYFFLEMLSITIIY